MPPSRKKPVQIEVEEQVDWAPKIEEKAEIADLRASLERIKSREGIIGYIIRGPTSASIDINNPSKIIDYAALSAEAHEFGEDFSEAFGLDKISSIVLEGKDIKILCLAKGEQRLSIFMERNVDHKAIYNQIS